MNFFVGQQVVCVKDDDKLYPSRPYPEKGGFYTIRSMIASPHGVCLRLCEIVNEPFFVGLPEPGYGAGHFRPLKKTDISIFTKLLAPTPREKVMA